VKQLPDDRTLAPGATATPISDYGKLYTSWATHFVCRPQSAAEVGALVADARTRGCAVRVRGSGHTFSGATIPRAGELLMRTDRLDYFLFEQQGTVTVGAGALAWDVRDLTATYGLAMPVYNGGWAGPTIGGYVAAGGMGLRVPPAERDRWLAVSPPAGEERPPLPSISETHGGFWEHVAAVTFVDGTGAVHHVTDDDELFPWLFASFGQLGVFVDVRLKLLATPDADPYPRGVGGRVPRVQTDDPAVNDLPPSSRGERILFWFSYLVSAEQEASAWTEIGAWAERHAPFLTPQGGWVGPAIGGEPIGYRYVVRHRRFHPPLLYPRGEDFVLMGLMTTFAGVGTTEADDRIFALERDFIDIARRRGFRLYPQAENIGRGVDYATYYDASTYTTFRRLKAQFDPDGIINPDVVFPSSVPAPERSALGRLSEATFERLLGGENMRALE
jgi:FAD/FMN-containing dehydrogenase